MGASGARSIIVDAEASLRMAADQGCSAPAGGTSKTATFTVKLLREQRSWRRTSGSVGARYRRCGPRRTSRCTPSSVALNPKASGDPRRPARKKQSHVLGCMRGRQAQGRFSTSVRCLRVVEKEFHHRWRWNASARPPRPLCSPADGVSRSRRAKRPAVTIGSACYCAGRPSVLL